VRCSNLPASWHVTGAKPAGRSRPLGRNAHLVLLLIQWVLLEAAEWRKYGITKVRRLIVFEKWPVG
jgi:hypothetical protein